MAIDFWQTIFVCFLGAVLFLSLVFLFAQSKKRYDIIDSAWGMTFIVIALTGLLLHGCTLATLLVTLLVCIWGARLSYHIFRRYLKSNQEDQRYVTLRASWKGNIAINAYVRIYLVQALLATIVGLSVIVIQYHKISFSGIFVVGVLVWIIGFLFEAIGDWQLKQHLKNSKNKGKLMTSGLWQYTRHPNYFGEAMMWWGIWLISLSTPLWWVALISPLLITYLLLFVSGVKATEAQFEGRPGWKEYKSRTSIFIPLPPKKV